MKKVVLFLLLGAVSLGFGFGINRYIPVGGNLLPGLQLTEGSNAWLYTKAQGAVVQDSTDSIRLHLSDPDTSVNLLFVINSPQRFALLRLSGDLKTENVVAGEKSWERARLLLSSYDERHKTLPVPHKVAALEGTNSWRPYSKVFSVSPDADLLRARVQLLRATGTMWVRNLQLHEVTISPLYHYGRYLIFTLWSAFILWLLTPYWRSRRLVSRKGLLPLLTLLAATLGGILMPGNLKIRILAWGNHWLKDTFNLSSPLSGSAATSATALLPWFDVTKAGHFFLFALLGAVFVMLRPDRRSKYIVRDLLMLAAASELLQLFVNGRSAQVTDWLIDTGGILLGMWCAGRWRKDMRTEIVKA